MKIGILGHGEVGQAIEKVYKDFDEFEIRIKDLNRNDGIENVEVLNICLPFSRSFVDIVSREINRINPKLTIIHSTIAPETTKKIKQLIQKDLFVVHSPIRGIHPQLYEGVKRFVKYVGGDSKEELEAAGNHLRKLGLNVRLFENSTTTEMGKLLDTTYYATVVAWHGEMKKMCDKYNLDFDKTVTDFNETYNKGYSELNKKNVIRPVLYPPPENKIGGHCLIPNAKLLKEIFDSEALDLILKYS